MTNIALVGTSPSSRMLAPYNDPSWEIWGCGPANAGALSRCDAWFELHDIKALETDASWTAYLAWLCLQPKVYGIKTDSRFPGMIPYPVNEMVKKFGGDFWTSSLAYMAALAIDSNPEAIGFWGVDMTSASEYGSQRAGCKFFIQIARMKGVRVVIPNESDLDRPGPMYGYREVDPMWNKLEIRRKELVDRMNMLRDQREKAVEEETLIRGALDNIEYVMGTWINGGQSSEDNLEKQKERPRHKQQKHIQKRRNRQGNGQLEIVDGHN